MRLGRPQWNQQQIWFQVRAIVEVKRNRCSTEELTEQLKKRTELLRYYGPISGVVISHPKPLFTRLLDDKNQPDRDGIMAFIYFLAQVAGHNNL